MSSQGPAKTDQSAPAAAPSASGSTSTAPSNAKPNQSLSYAEARAIAPLHYEVLDAQKSDVLTVLLALRFSAALCIRTFFQPDEYFQALEPAWKLVNGPASGAWITWEWRHQLRSSLHPVLFAGIYAGTEGLMQLMHIVGPLRGIIVPYLPAVAQGAFSAIGEYFLWRLASQFYGQVNNPTWATLWLTITSPWQWYCGTRTFSNGLETALTSAALAFWPWQLFGNVADVTAETLFSKVPVRRLRISLVLAATAVVLRPTNVLIWVSLLTIAVTRMTLDGPAASASLKLPILARLAAEIIGSGLLVLGLSAASDRLFYGIWTFPAYTFLDINLTKDIAVFYGRNDWHYYLSQGLPLLTTTSLPFALYGIYAALAKHTTTTDAAALQTANAQKALAFAAITSIAALSLVAHKEVRFLWPILPILQVLAAPHVVSVFTKTVQPEPQPAAEKTPPSAPSASPASTLRPSPKIPASPETVLTRKALLGAALSINAILAIYLSFLHQAAPISVVSFLRTEYERIHHDWLELPANQLPVFDTVPDSFMKIPTAAITSDGDGDEMFALFLVPCHSTPWRSHLVYPGLRARALTCEPPLDTAPGSPERASYLDEADRFYEALKADDPADKYKFFSELWPRLPHADEPRRKQVQRDTWGDRRRGGEIPRYIVGFEGIEETLNGFFSLDDTKIGGADLGVKTPLYRAWTGFNGFFNEDWRRRGSLVVWDTGVYSNDSHPDVVSRWWIEDDEWTVPARAQAQAQSRERQAKEQEQGQKEQK